MVSEKPPAGDDGSEPLTIGHFLDWASRLVLDNGEFWTVEDFQREIVQDWLDGFIEVWALIPEGNAKTTLLAAVALYHADYVPTPFVPIGASSREQAEIMYRQAEGFVVRSDSIRDHFKCQEGYRRIKSLRTFGRIQVYAADDRTADGVIPTLAILDELHRHRDLRLYRTWRGKLAKRGGQIIAISTAGEPESEFEETRARILATADTVEKHGKFGSRIRAVAKSIVLHDWAVRDRKQADNIEVVKEANPLSTITEEMLAEKRESATMTDSHWLRFVCNIPSRPEGLGVLPEDWDSLYDKALVYTKDSKKYGFWDHAWRIDCAAIGVIAWESHAYRPITGLRIFEPPVSDDDVVDALIDFNAEFSPEGFVYDPNAGAESMVQQLEKGEHPRQVERGAPPLKFIEHSQANAAMALAASRMEEAIRLRAIKHNGDPDLRKHVLSSVKKPLGGDKFRYDRPSDAKGERRQKYPIDAFTGLLMGHSVAVAENADSGPQDFAFM